jgi:hypothetical protein
LDREVVMLIACGDLDVRQQRVVVFVRACPMGDRITHECNKLSARRSSAPLNLATATPSASLIQNPPNTPYRGPDSAYSAESANSSLKSSKDYPSASTAPTITVSTLSTTHWLFGSPWTRTSIISSSVFPALADGAEWETAF